MRHSGAGHGPAGNVYLSEANSHGTFASRSVLHLFATTLLKVGGLKEQPCVIWGVIVSIHVMVVQEETVGPRSTVIRVKHNEVDYLLTHLKPWITVPFRYAAKTPSIREPFKEDVMPNELFTCGVEECKHGGGWWYGYRSEARGEEDE